MPEAAVAETTVAAVTKPRGRAERDVTVITGDTHPEVVLAKAAKEPAKAEEPADKAKAEEKAKPAPKADADEEIDHPDAEKKGKLNERFSELTKARKAAEEKAEAEGKARKDAATRAEAAERDAAALRAKYEPPKGDDIGPEPQPEQFSDTKEFAKALKDWTADSVRIEDAKKSKAEREAKENAERVSVWRDAEAAIRQEVPEYDKRLSDSPLVISDQVRDAIVDAGPLGPRILLHLAEHPEIGESLKDMSALRAVRKIGEIEAEVRKTVKAEARADAKEAKTVAGQHSAAEISRAPAPISPLNGGDPVVRLSGGQEFHGSFEDYKAHRRAGRIK